MPFVSCIVVDECPAELVTLGATAGSAGPAPLPRPPHSALPPTSSGIEDRDCWAPKDPVFESHLRRCRELAASKGPKRFSPPAKADSASRMGRSGADRKHPGQAGSDSDSDGAGHDLDASLEDALAAFGDVATQEMMEGDESDGVSGTPTGAGRTAGSQTSSSARG